MNKPLLALILFLPNASYAGLCGVSTSDFDAIVEHYGLTPDATVAAAALQTPFDCTQYGDICGTDWTPAEQHSYVCDRWTDLGNELAAATVFERATSEVAIIGCMPSFSTCVAKCGSAECVGACFAYRVDGGPCQTKAICYSQAQCGGGIKVLPFMDFLGGF